MWINDGRTLTHSKIGSGSDEEQQWSKPPDWIVIGFPTSKMVGVHKGYTQIRGDDLDG
jgi:hypothetical protein